MTVTEKQLDELRAEVLKRESAKRAEHTFGVERAAKRIGEAIMPERVAELRAAALLHDITKELDNGRQLSLMRDYGYEPTPSDLLCVQIYHAFSAPAVIKKEFPELALPDILSSVFNHTTGEVGMSLFDEIILLSDCIEDGRSYESATLNREELYAALDSELSYEEKLIALHRATVRAFNSTLNILIEKNRFIHEKTVASRNYILSLINASENK